MILQTIYYNIILSKRTDYRLGIWNWKRNMSLEGFIKIVENRTDS